MKQKLEGNDTIFADLGRLHSLSEHVLGHYFKDDSMLILNDAQVEH